MVATPAALAVAVRVLLSMDLEVPAIGASEEEMGAFVVGVEAGIEVIMKESSLRAAGSGIEVVVAEMARRTVAAGAGAAAAAAAKMVDLKFDVLVVVECASGDCSDVNRSSVAGLIAEGVAEAAATLTRHLGESIVVALRQAGIGVQDITVAVAVVEEPRVAEQEANVPETFTGEPTPAPSAEREGGEREKEGGGGEEEEEEEELSMFIGAGKSTAWREGSAFWVATIAALAGATVASAV